ncbi:hypothetical protein GCM10017687_05760 [Streptomyces echinatus]
MPSPSPHTRDRIRTRSTTPVKPSSAPDRQLDDERGGMEPVADRADRPVEVGARAVQLVDERDSRDAVPVGLPPHRLALRFDPGDGVEHGDRPVQDAQGALDLVGEVDMAGGVDEVDAMAVPGAADRGGEDGDATVAFLRVEVGDGGAVVHLAPLVGGARRVQDPLGDGGLAGVDVGEDAEVADGGEGVDVRAHGPVPFGKWCWRRAARFPVCRWGGRYGGGRTVPGGAPGSAGRHGHPVPAAQRTPDGRGHQDHLVPGTGSDDSGACAHGRAPLCVGRQAPPQGGDGARCRASLGNGPEDGYRFSAGPVRPHRSGAVRYPAQGADRVDGQQGGGR